MELGIGPNEAAKLRRDGIDCQGLILHSLQFNSILYFNSHRAIQFYTVFQVIYVINILQKVFNAFIKLFINSYADSFFQMNICSIKIFFLVHAYTIVH